MYVNIHKIYKHCFVLPFLAHKWNLLEHVSHCFATGVPGSWALP